jgi:hypothetical protein
MAGGKDIDGERASSIPFFGSLPSCRFGSQLTIGDSPSIATMAGDAKTATFAEKEEFHEVEVEVEAVSPTTAEEKEIRIEPTASRRTWTTFRPEDPEPRKPVIQSRWRHIRSGLLLHSPGMILSVTLIVLNTLGCFWFEMERSVRITGSLEISTINVLHLLQLAAKAYEMLLVLSLSSIVLAMYRRLLVTRGLPLGLITAGYRTGSFVYLRSSALAVGMADRRYLSFGLFVVFTTVLLVLSAPACAILMVPTPGWWSMGSDYASVLPPVTYTRRQEFIWPRTIDTDGMVNRMKRSCGQWDTTSDFSCPGNGYSELRQWVTEWNGDSLRGPHAAITVKSATVTTEVYREVVASLPGNGSATYATTLSSVPALAVRSYFDYVTMVADVGRISHASNVRIMTRPEDKTFQPLTQTQCRTFDIADVRTALGRNQTDGLPFWPMEQVECYDDDECRRWKALTPGQRLVDLQLFDHEPKAPNISFKFVETPGALAAVFTVPYLTYPDWRNLSRINDLSQGAATQGYMVTACSFVSRWVPSTLSAELSQTRLMTSNVSDPAVFSPVNGTLPPQALGAPIKVTKEWADFLDFNISGLYTDADNAVAAKGQGAMSNLLHTLVYCGSRNDSHLCTFGLDLNARDAVSVPRVAEKLLGMAVADGLSRVGLVTNRGASHGLPEVVEELSEQRISWRYLVSVWWYPGSGLVRNCSFVPNPDEKSVAAGMHSVYRCMHNGTTYSNPYKDTMAEAKAEFESYHRFGMDVARYGYGSGAPSPTLNFALAVVGLYIATVVVYVLASLGIMVWETFGRQGLGMASRVRGISGWDDVQDLVALAWKSRAPVELENVGAGVRSWSRVWKEVAVVRVNEYDCLELVLEREGEGEGEGQVRTGSRDDDEDHGGLRRRPRIPERGKMYG